MKPVMPIAVSMSYSWSRSHRLPPSGMDWWRRSEKDEEEQVLLTKSDISVVRKIRECSLSYLSMFPMTTLHTFSPIS